MKMGRSPLSPVLILVLCMAAGAWGQTLLDPISRACRGMADANQAKALSRNEYPAGGLLMVLASVPAGVKGFFKFYLCLDDDAGQEECLNKKSLQLADGSGDTFDLSKVVKEGSYEIPLTIPDDVTCDTCSVQWHVEVEDCGDNAGCSLISQDSCFDVKIRQAKKEEKRFFRMIFGAVKAIGKGIHHLVKKKRRRG
ncbi:chitin binding-like protein [Penaeus vannamei]|uniref:Chitin binding-like protein n=1 Tax=Penaeus vannamei TaxID=6689 RepID=A0A3R7MFB3_PENVA|nr:chitin binding-like protein [Penaeus vannamei]